MKITTSPPLILVGGALGAGKTSLLHHFISEYQGGSLALLLEDYGELNLDAKAIRGLCGAMRRTQDEVLEIPGGPENEKVNWVARKLAQAHSEKRVNVAFLEVSGLGKLSSWVRSLTTVSQIIWVVDALDVWQSGLRTSQFTSVHFFEQSQDDIATATVLVLNKCDLLDDAQRESCRRMVRSLNAHAILIETAYGEMAREVWQRLLSEKEATRSMQVASPKLENRSDALSVIKFIVHRPFHPERCWRWFNAEHSGLVRVKGIIWLATRNLLVGGVSRTRWENSCGAAGIWWAALPREEWPSDPDALLRMHEVWREPFGDRRQELVLVGTSPDLEKITAELTACLLTDEEYAQALTVWLGWDDPFPEWDTGEDVT